MTMAHFKRALRRFENAVEENAFKGSIASSVGESAAAASAYERIEREYRNARAAVLRAAERLIP